MGAQGQVRGAAWAILLGAAIITALANQREASEPAGARAIGEHRASSTGQYYKACSSATFSDGQKIVFRCTRLVAGG